ncbi:MAG: hypothetical protein GY952_11935 [Rhodobacteraceae bacterium]|nr:hypothetical protein [Paracoccaceae bacterium]
MSETINYGNLMHRAMRGLMNELLRDIAANGLPGDHHFFITLDTTHPGVDIADWLRERFPKEMTIVIQHEYGDLSVTDDRFSVVLSFGDQPEPLVIPFESIKTFVDPSVEFGLRFENQDGEENEVPESPMIMLEDDEEEDMEPEKAEAEVVSLDSFRK